MHVIRFYRMATADAALWKRLEGHLVKSARSVTIHGKVVLLVSAQKDLTNCTFNLENMSDGLHMYVACVDDESSYVGQKMMTLLGQLGDNSATRAENWYANGVAQTSTSETVTVRDPSKASPGGCPPTKKRKKVVYSKTDGLTLRPLIEKTQIITPPTTT